MVRWPLVAIVSALLLVSACSGSSRSRKFDPVQGDKTAHAALLRPSDLQGEGWSTSADDKFESEEEFAGTKSCSEQVELLKKANSTTSGHAERAMQSVSGGQPHVFDLEVSIFKDAAIAKDVYNAIMKAASNEEA